MAREEVGLREEVDELRRKLIAAESSAAGRERELSAALQVSSTEAEARASAASLRGKLEAGAEAELLLEAQLEGAQLRQELAGSSAEVERLRSELTSMQQELEQATSAQKAAREEKARDLVVQLQAELINMRARAESEKITQERDIRRVQDDALSWQAL